VQDFRGAVTEYDRLIAIDPHFLVPRREKARVLFSDHQFAAAQAAYQEVLVPTADDRLVQDLNAYVSQDPATRALLAPCFHAGTPAKMIRAEILKALPAVGEAASALHRILADYDARAAEQAGVRLEAEGKAKKDFRNYEAVPVYQKLTTLEPGNVEGLFDLGQVYGGLRQTHNALTEFGRVLEVDPQHRESLVASERAGLELQPQLRSSFDFFHQSGRDGLALIDRTRYGTTLTWPYGDENEWVRLGFSRVYYSAPHAPGLDGNIITLGAEGKCCDSHLLLYGLANLEQYENRIHDRVTYDTGLDYAVCDLLHLRASSFLENVVENAESIRQDIYRIGFNAGADLHPTRYWNVSGTYRFAYYSDVNQLNEVFLSTDYSLTLPPKQLKLVATVDYEGYAKQTIFLDPTHQSAFGAVHPYFAPSSFTYYEGRVEWYQWLSRDYFTYSNQCWYSLQYGLGWDNRFQPYQDVRGLLNYDVAPWLTVGGYAQGLFSHVYDSFAFGAFVNLRFPCRLNFARIFGCDP
jgi:hypothetical protein